MHQLGDSNPGAQLDLGDMRAGSLLARFARSPEEVKASQELRYRVFVEEMGAISVPDGLRTKRDEDHFDAVCDHLVVIDQASFNRKIVGSYRLLRRCMMAQGSKFYAEGEFDLSAIRGCPEEILELGRSCVDPAYRSRAVMRLLWRAIGAYIANFDVKLLFGCASFHGTAPDAHAMALAYLHHYCMAPSELRPIALTHRRVEMDRMPKEAIDVKKAIARLPALVKGYLRLNGRVGLGAVIDHGSNTTDVCIVLDAARIADKYLRRFGMSRSDRHVP